MHLKHHSHGEKAHALVEVVRRLHYCWQCINAGIVAKLDEATHTYHFKRTYHEGNAIERRINGCIVDHMVLVHGLQLGSGSGSGLRIKQINRLWLGSLKAEPHITPEIMLG